MSRSQIPRSPQTVLRPALCEPDREDPLAPLVQVRVACEKAVEIGVYDAREPREVSVGDLLHRTSVHQANLLALSRASGAGVPTVQRPPEDLTRQQTD
jgi:hypothetical protein